MAARTVTTLSNLKASLPSYTAPAAKNLRIIVSPPPPPPVASESPGGYRIPAGLGLRTAATLVPRAPGRFRLLPTVVGMARPCGLVQVDRRPRADSEAVMAADSDGTAIPRTSSCWPASAAGRSRSDTDC